MKEEKVKWTKKVCRKCGRNLNRWWKYCPVCGETTTKARILEG